MGIYTLHPAVAIEPFDVRALALHCEDLRLVELNATAADLLSRLDGATSLRKVAEAMAADYGQPLSTVWADIQDIVAHMMGLGLVRQVYPEGPSSGPDEFSAS